MTIKIAQLSCGTEYSSVQYEIEKAARSVGAKIVYPDVSAADIDDAVRRFGFTPRSPPTRSTTPTPFSSPPASGARRPPS